MLTSKPIRSPSCRGIVTLIIAVGLTCGVAHAESRFGQKPVEGGYLPSPWAKSTEPPTLAALRKLRPAKLPDHPLATWVADRIARDTGKTPEMPQLDVALKAFKQQGGFWVRDDASGFWLSNGVAGVALLPASQGAGVASLYNLQTNTECIFKPQPASTPWRLRVLKSWPALTTTAPTTAPVIRYLPDMGPDLSYLKDVDGGALPAKFVFEITPSSEAKLTIRWQPVEVAKESDRFTVTATIAMEAASPLTRWRADVSRVDGASKTYNLVALKFPTLRSLAAPGETDAMFSWGGRGRGHLYRNLKAWGNMWLTYPHGGWQMQFVSLSFGPDCAMYLACHDGQGFFKQCSLLSEQGDGTSFTHVAWSTDELKMPYDVVLGPVKGDWYDNARTYRQWALNQTWCAKGPLSKRVADGTVSREMIETDFWVRPDWIDGGAWHFGYDEVKDEENWFLEGKLPKFIPPASQPAPSRAAHPPKIGVWWYGWMNEAWDTHYPMLTARPGVSEVFAEHRALGVTIMPFVNAQWWDINQPAFDDAAKAAVTKGMDHKAGQWNLNGTLSQICSSQKLLSDTVARLAEQLHKLGANAIYLDTYPSQGSCWDTTHGHPLGPGGNWDYLNQRRILTRIKQEQGQQFGIMTEGQSEPLMDCLDAQMSWWYVEPSDAPLWPAVYGGYTVISGTHTYDDDLVAFRLKVGRPFIWGSQLGRSIYSDHLMRRETAEFMRRLACLRSQTKKFFTYGDFLRPPKWTTPVPRVKTQRWLEEEARHILEYDALECALWQAPDGDLALAIVNFDDKQHTASFDAKDVFPDNSRRAGIVNWEGEKEWKVVNSGDALSTEIPAADAIVIVFRK